MSQACLVIHRRHPECTGGGVIVVITALLVAGIRETARFNNFIVAVKLVVIALFIVCTVPAFSTANWVTASNPQGAFIPPNAGVGDLRLVGPGARRGRGVLCLYRLRCGLDGGAGGEKPDAGHADRHSRLAGDLHGTVRRGRLGSHRHRPVRQTECSRPDRGRHRRGRRRLAFPVHQAGHHLRTDLGDPGHAAGAAENFPRHGA